MRLGVAVATLAAGVGAGPAPAAAADLDRDAVERVSLLAQDRRPTLTALVVRDPDGGRSLVLRAFDPATGSTVGDPVRVDSEGEPVDVLVSSVLAPGAVVALEALPASGRLPARSVVNVYDVTTDERGPRVAQVRRVVDEQDQPQLGDGSVRFSHLAEVPARDDRGLPLLAVGGDGGVAVAGLAVAPGKVVVNHEEQYRVVGTLTDLEVVPQAGRFALAAVVDGDVVLGDPHAAPEDFALARLTDPRRARDPGVPALLDLAAPRLRPDSRPPAEVDAVPVLSANGTASLATYALPSISDGTGGTLVLKTIEPVCVPVRQVVLGSLTMLPVDGSGLLYDRRYALDDPVLRTTWTIAGASAELEPEQLHGQGQGRWLTLTIEVADGGAARIDPGTVVLRVGDRVVPASERRPPVRGLLDGDRNPDLQVAVDRGALRSAVGGRRGEVPVQVTWRTEDGAPGRALTVVRAPGR